MKLAYRNNKPFSKESEGKLEKCLLGGGRKISQGKIPKRRQDN